MRLYFEDGKSGIVDFSSYLNRNGVFKKLNDINYFKNFIVDPEVKTLVWGNEIDIEPETLYFQSMHSPLPEWMRK